MLPFTENGPGLVIQTGARAFIDNAREVAVGSVDQLMVPHLWIYNESGDFRVL